MQVLVAGDWHSDLVHAAKVAHAARDAGIDLILQLGDWGFLLRTREEMDALEVVLAELGIRVWWLDGNHESFSLMAELGCDPCGDEPVQLTDHITYLPRGCVFELDGIRFMAFGGAVSSDQTNRWIGVSWWHQESITMAQVNKARDEKVDVLLTHDAPDRIPSVENWCDMHPLSDKLQRESKNNRIMVGMVVDDTEPVLVVHGHHHHRYSAKRIGVTGRPVIVEGLASNVQDAGSWVILDTDNVKRMR